MTLACINRGGRQSLVRIEGRVTLEQEVPFSAAAAAALACWQARPGEIVSFCDAEGAYYRGRLLSLTQEGGRLLPFHRYPGALESPVAIELYQALPEKERFEFVQQKLTETGVARIVPFTSERSVTLEERDAGQKKSHRWPQVILRAAKQCRRAMLPELYPVCSWDQALYLGHGADLRLILSDRAAPWSLKEVVEGESPHRVALLVGPEGGFSDTELAEARAMGYLPVSMGPRVFRTETAAMVGAAIVQYALGDLG